MNSQIFDKICDWNPQLFRELKGRLKFRNVAIAIAISVLTQGLLMFLFWSQLPIADPLSDNICRSYYCFIKGSKILDGNAIDWTMWWLDQFKLLTWGIPLFLIPSGVYFLVSDLSQEQQKGTLNFIRLSPQSSRSILLGKILGVPAMSYVGVATVLPFYFWAAFAGGVSLGFLLSYVLIIGVGCYFVYGLALLCAFLLGAKSNSLHQAGAGLAMSVSALLFTWVYMLVNITTTWRQFKYSLHPSALIVNIEWFYSSISENAFVAHALVLGSLSVGINATWFALNRSFHNPNATVLNKSRSYFLVAFTELLALGFFVRDAGVNQYQQSSLLSIGLVLMYAFNLFAFLVLIAILTPQRQTLIDWARYRHMAKVSLFKDLLWSEKSPAMLAIAINLGIVSVILLPWLIWNPADRNYFGNNIWLTPANLIIGLISTGLITLIYAAIAQLILLMKTPIRQQLAIGVVGALIIIPPAVLTLLFGDPTKHLLLWMLTGSPWIAIFNPAVVNVAIATSVHGGILLALTLTLRQKLIKVGESEFKLHSARNTARMSN